MSNFIYDNGPLPFPKTNLNVLPIGADPTEYVQDTDWNELNQAVTDIQTVLRGAKWIGLETQSSDPTPAGITNYLWLSTSNILTVKAGISSIQLVPAARQIIAGSGLSGGGTLSADRTLSLETLSPSPAGTYNKATITVDSHGRVTSASSNLPGDAAVYLVTKKVASFTALAGYLHEVDPTGGAIVATLPDANTNPGAVVFIKNITSSSTTITVSAAGSDTIEGQASLFLADPYTSVTLVSDGNSPGNWSVLQQQTIVKLPSGGHIIANGAGNTASSTGFAQGSGTTASGTFSHSEGVNTTASATGSHAEGYYSVASRKEQWAYASGKFSTAGDAQTSVLVLRGSTPGSAPAESVELKFDDGTQTISLEDTKSYSFVVTATAGGVQSGPTRVSRTFRTNFNARRDSGVSTITASGVGTDFGDSATADWTLVTSIGVTPDRITFTFTTGATTSACKVVAKIEFTEVLF